MFGHLHNDLTAVRQIRQDRSGWVVPVPDVVVDQLVVPAALAGLDVQSDQGIRKKIVTGPIAAEAIAGGRFHWQVDQAQFRITRHLRPDAGITSNFCAIAEPGFNPYISALGNGTKGPQKLS